MNVLFYGRLRERAGAQIDVHVEEGCSVRDLRSVIANAHPSIREDMLSTRVRACVEDMVVPEDYRVSSGQTVEFIPPVSGG